MEQFDVLHKPWIPLEMPDGKQTELGLLEALTQAHCYTGLCCESPLEEAAIYRLLIAFLMDAYRPKQFADRKRLYQNGKFHPDVLQEYVRVCKSEGCSFDLFSKERPFMQAAYCEKLDKEEAPVAKLLHTAVSGNNHTHFEHHHENDYSLSYAQALRALLASYLFCPALVQGYPSSVNNTPCNYYFCMGQTLFETLVLNMVAENQECGEIPYSKPSVAWREAGIIQPKQEFATMSLLAAFTWQPRRVTLIAEDGFVRNVYYQQGNNFLGNGLWKDPHAAYRKTKSGDWSAVKPQIGRSFWRDIGALTSGSTGAESVFQPPQSVHRYANFMNSEEEKVIVPLRVVGLVTSNAAFEEVQEDRLSIPLQLIKKAELGEYLQSDIAQVEKMAQAIGKVYKKLGQAATKSLQGQYFAAWHQVLFPGYLEKLASINLDADGWQQEMDEAFEMAMQRILRDIQKKAEVFSGAGAKQMVSLVLCNQNLKKEYYSMRKRRVIHED